MAVLGHLSLMAGKVSSTMEREVEVEGPDPDAIKMFVGQVPLSMDEVGQAYCILVERPPPSLLRTPCKSSSPPTARSTSSTFSGTSQRALVGQQQR